MLASVASAGPEGFEHYTFECSGCGHSETSSVGWPPFLTETTFSVTARQALLNALEREPVLAGLGHVLDVIGEVAATMKPSFAGLTAIACIMLPFAPPSATRG